MTIPIIGCTGNTLERDIEIFRISGCDRVIGKPFNIDLFHQYMTDLTSSATTSASVSNKKDTTLSEKIVERQHHHHQQQQQQPPQPQQQPQQHQQQQQQQSTLRSIKEKDKEKNSSESSLNHSCDSIPWVNGVSDELQDKG